MGGKHKQAQRTKNNARPSSSGRSAELLGASIPTFVGFSAAKDGGFVPVIPGFSVTGLDDIDPNIDSNFQLVLKKMSKKDATTKHKALQEFSELVTNSDIEILKTVLPFWPRLYCSLAVDTDHRVREASHIAQRAVALKAKRNLAPYLKQLIGPWFTSQYDSYAPAASAAQQAFEDAFPPAKISEVIAFCQEEILSYIYDNLIENNFQSSANTKHLNAEEIEARNQRILVASLQGYSLYLKKVSSSQSDVAIESNRKIVANSKFWKFSKHKVPLIRTAWFATLGTLLQHAPPTLLENEGQRVTTTVLANLDETDPTVVPVVWETALLALFTVQDWWTHINVEKLVLPKLWRVLRDAAQGNASSIYPNLLPLISKFPPGSDSHAFYTSFFDNIRLGLKQKSVQQSRSELNSVVTSFMECLQYVILRNQTDYPLCESLMKKQLIETIEWSILEGHFITKIFFSQLTTLVHYWSRNRDNVDMPLYGQLLDGFWIYLTVICENIFSKTSVNFDSDARNNIHTKIIELLFTLKRNYSIKPKKQLKVQFSEGKVQDSVTTPTDGNTTSVDKNDSKFVNELHVLAYRICELYIQNMFEFINLYIFHLSSIIQEFDSIDLFTHLRDKFNFGSTYDIYNKIFSVWFETNEAREVAVDLTFILMKYLKADEMESILNTFCTLNEEKVFLRCVSQGLAHPYRNMDTIRIWLKRDEITNLLENCANNIINEKETGNIENLALLRLACGPDDNGDLLINTDALMKIVQVFCKPLINPSDYLKTLDICARFAAVLSAFIYSEENVQSYNNIDLLIALFTLNTNNEITTDTLSEDTLWEINTAWQDAVTVLRTVYALESDEFLDIVNKFAIALKNTIINATEQIVDDEIIDKNVKLTIEFFKSACTENLTVGRIGFLLTMILKHFDTSYVIYTLAQTVLDADIIEGTYVSIQNRPQIESIYQEKFQQLDRSDEKRNSVEELNQMMAFSEYSLRLITKLYEKPKSDDDDDEEEDRDATTPESDALPLELLIPDMENEIIFHIFKCALLQMYCEYYKITIQFEPIDQNLGRYKKSLVNLLNTLHADMIEEINSNILNSALTIGFFWSRTYYILNTQYISKNLARQNINDLFVNGLRSTSLTSIGWLHWIQTFANDLQLESINLEGKSQVECLAVIRSIPMSNNSDVFMSEALGIIKTIHKRSDILLHKDISTQSWESVQVVVEVIRFMTKVVKYRAHLLSSTYWDFIFIGLNGWIETVRKSLKPDSNLLILAMGASICDLFTNVSIYLKDIKNDIASGEAYQKLVEEWEDVVAVDVCSSIFRFYKCAIENMTDKNYDNYLIMFKHICNCVPYLNKDAILRSEVQIKWRDCANNTINLLNSHLPGQQIASAILLQNVICLHLVEIDSSAVAGESRNDEQLTITMFQTILEKSQMIVESMVHDLRLGEQSCQVKPFTEAYQYTSCYLLTWSVLLTMLTKASSNLRYQYTEWFRDHDYFKILMHNVLRLMPEKVLDPMTQPSSSLAVLFEKLPTFSPTEGQTIEWIESCACGVFSGALAVTPALVRQWWSNSESRVARIVERITSTFISSQLCARELQDLTKQSSEHMQVRVHPTAREVIATYSVDEARMEITISLPQNYPLGSVKIDCNKQIGATNQWRNSIMQLSLFLTHQNGNVMDGLSLWKSNLDKHFEGVEECYICFSVIHAGTMQLPKLSCQKCRKKFHSACLYKWFSTSNKSTCPICRSLF